ncbi:hypothetical protein [Kosakonia oryzae]|uniref:Uncharacterized protein n=1 Tax=Kosakonia oryzae TaxID=497725 RepID=A0ABX7PXX8_9ENTR|nr:hypothetical protein [Kosakonia oryzae]QSV12335.1 hypothetical protein AWR26_25135 [Kosakonia oryzae]UDJ81152.1 hypothetical protein I5186_18550 [Kosakonia oryzae]
MSGAKAMDTVSPAREITEDDEPFQAKGRNFRPFLFAAILIPSTILIIFNHAAAADI